MTKKKREEEPKKFEVKKRAPKDKPNFFQNVTPFSHPVAEIFNFYNDEIPVAIEPQPESADRPDPTNPTQSISPKNDYAKVANSITREAVPDRLFKGMSKNTYDALYLKTRGAINPVRRIRATRSDLIRWAGVSDVTIDKHIKHLKSIGLLKVDFITGSHEGNWYEVFIPEEVDPTNQPYQPNPTNITKKVGNHIPNFLGYVGRVYPIENKGAYEFPKTSLKTIHDDDDDALADFARAMDEASRKLTEKGLSKSEKGKWKELADFLIMELEIAVARTESISSLPAFLTEHLRRRLLRKSQNPANRNHTEKKESGKPPQIGKSSEPSVPNIQSYEAEALSEHGRATVLKTMREYITKNQKEFVLSLEDTFTVEDWHWLIKNLGASDKI